TGIGHRLYRRRPSRHGTVWRAGAGTSDRDGIRYQGGLRRPGQPGLDNARRPAVAGAARLPPRRAVFLLQRHYRLPPLTAAYCRFSRSRISRNRATSSGGGAGSAWGATSFSRSTERLAAFTAFTRQNTTKASSTKLMKIVRKLPHESTTAPAA